jgi:hypothetical protein
LLDEIGFEFVVSGSLFLLQAPVRRPVARLLVARFASSSTTDAKSLAGSLAAKEESEKSAPSSSANEAQEEAQDPNENENGEYVNPVTREVNGPRGPEPTRYGDWERKGRCTDF